MPKCSARVAAKCLRFATVETPAPGPLTVHLRPVRLEKGWTQEELARRSGVDQSTISRIENGLTRGVGLGIVERLADALDLNPRALLASSDR